jgi:hypothetical protein
LKNFSCLSFATSAMDIHSSLSATEASSMSRRTFSQPFQLWVRVRILSYLPLVFRLQRCTLICPERLVSRHWIFRRLGCDNLFVIIILTFYR